MEENRLYTRIRKTADLSETTQARRQRVSLQHWKGNKVNLEFSVQKKYPSKQKVKKILFFGPDIKELKEYTSSITAQQK